MSYEGVTKLVELLTLLASLDSCDMESKLAPKDLADKKRLSNSATSVDSHKLGILRFVRL